MALSLTTERLILTVSACALSVATPYYNQPMAPLVKESFGAAAGNGGAVATLTQIGYAAGLILFVPLGDKLDPRPLIVALLLTNIVALVASAAAPNFMVLVCASFFVGVTAPTAQIIIPAMSGLAAPQEGGRLLGLMLSGLSSGVLLGRVVSGAVASYLGWRTMFWFAALIDLLLIAVVWRLFPLARPATEIAYGRLLGSMIKLFLEEPGLRLASISGFLFFGAYNAIWSTIAFLLSRPPYSFGTEVVGMFGFASLAGLLASPTIGRLTDRHGSKIIAGTGALSMMAAFGMILESERTLIFLIAGVALLDIGHRAGLVANQASIYSVRPEARSRLNTIFMSCFFIGGAAGAALGAEAGALADWKGVAFLGCSFSFLAALAHAVSRPQSPPHKVGGD